MANLRYPESAWKDVDPLLRKFPITEVEKTVPMTGFTLRNRCKKLGIKPVPPKRRGRKLKPKQISSLLSNWGVARV